MTTAIGSGAVQYIVTVMIVFCGTVLLAVIMQKMIGFAETTARYKIAKY